MKSMFFPIILGMVVGVLLGLFGYDIRYVGRDNESAVPAAKIPHVGRDAEVEHGKKMPECNFTDVKSRPDDLCNYRVTFREYDAIASNANQNYTLYGVKEGQAANAAISKGDWKLIGGEKIPVCRIIQTTKSGGFCWDEESIQPMLVAYGDDGTIAVVAPNDYFDIKKGYRIVSLLKAGF